MNPLPATLLSAPEEIVYPDSDGEPMADNTRQFEWIVTIQGGLAALFQDDPQVFVAGDLLWYPVEGQPRIRVAPDAMVVFGRPKGHRGSYQQWREDDIPPQVVFEVLSPGNRPTQFGTKVLFYEHHGVEEFYVYDPDDGTLDGWQRTDGLLQPIDSMRGWVSPRLGVTFDLAGNDLVLIRPDGERFTDFVTLHQEREAAKREAEAARHEAREARHETQEARQEAAAERQRAERMAAQLRALGIEPGSEAQAHDA